MEGNALSLPVATRWARRPALPAGAMQNEAASQFRAHVGRPLAGADKREQARGLLALAQSLDGIV